MKFKVGDKVRVLKAKNSIPVGLVFTITQSLGDDTYSAYSLPIFKADELELFLATSLNVTFKSETNMTLLQSFSLAFKSEPEKSFRKAGITNGDDLLTPEGTQVFLGWLLNTHKAAFKTEVVDAILAEQKENK